MKIRKSYLLEVSLQQKTNNAFPTDTFLDGKEIIAIEAFSASQVSVSPNGAAVANADKVGQAFVSFDVDGSQHIQNMPVQSLVASNNNGIVKEFENLKLRLNKSIVSFPNPSGISDGETILFNFYYID